jgi:hypothetical protein
MQNIIPQSINARFSGYHITLSGPNKDVDRTANLLLNYGFATAEESCEEISLQEKRMTLTFYRKNLSRALQTFAETGFLAGGPAPAIRRKKDGRKEKAIRSFYSSLSLYADGRKQFALGELARVTEDIGERAEIIEGRRGRGLHELVTV